MELTVDRAPLSRLPCHYSEHQGMKGITLLLQVNTHVYMLYRQCQLFLKRNMLLLNAEPCQT